MNREDPTRPGPKPAEGLTVAQSRMMEAIQAFVDEYGMPPTVQELADVLKIKGATVHEQLGKLVRKGYLKRMPRKARSLEIIRRDAPPTRLVSVPIVGRVAAGLPILAEENVAGEVLVESSV
ncbi:MAG: MarR family transcriptional regulator, partial [Nitrospirae bacterium]|nr:MarR family transcriptional regulator [Magnetococcales bacterium]